MKRLWAILLICFVALTARIYGKSGETNLIVTLKSEQAIAHLNRDLGMATVRQVPGQSIYLVQGGGNATAALQKLRKDTTVESAELDQAISLNAAVPQVLSGLSTDTMFLLDRQTLVDFYGTSVLRAYVEQDALSIIHAKDARAITTGAGARVAYIDTGIDPSHPALLPWISPGVDLVENVGESELNGVSPLKLRDTDTAYLLDTDTLFLLDQRYQIFSNTGIPGLSASSSSPMPPAFGHGTMVAGAIHAVAPEAKLVPIKAFDAYGNTTLFTVIDAVNRAVDMGVDVINMSFSTTTDSVTLRKAISRAYSCGIAIAASAGNDGLETSDAFPAAYTTVFGVAASDFQDRIAPFSNYGKAVSITAPGAFVISTVPGGGYAAGWGTSFSAPLVSGALALLASEQQHFHSQGVIVLNTADPIDVANPGYKGNLGKGRLNAFAAVNQGR